MKKVAVMLPHAYRGGSLRGAKNIAKSIAFAAQEKQEDVQVVFSYVENGNYDPYEDFDDLKEYGISLRATTWRTLNIASALSALQIINVDAHALMADTYCIPTDGANDFLDCELWIIISDRLLAPILPVRKYVSVVYDYIQRYVPEIWKDRSIWQNQEKILFSVVRNAEMVFVTTPSTRADLMAYAGISDRQINLLEMDFEPVDLKSPTKNKGVRNNVLNELPNDYFVWSTNISFHKNHIRALKALAMYYQELGGGLDVVVTGPDSEYFDTNRNFSPELPKMNLDHIQLGRNLIENSFGLKSHLHFMGNVPDRVYTNLLNGAKFLWHPTLYDNGTFSVMEAAYFQKPSLSARYPAMEFINDKFNLNITFFNPYKVQEMALEILEMEQGYQKIQLPDRATLMNRNWKSFASNLFQLIYEIL